MNCIQKSTFDRLRVAFNKHSVVFLVSHGDAAPVQCMLILVLITLKQQRENQLLDSYNE